ncbi:MAG TPA: helix-turn-helix domain-containing protein [Gammaproteobacteria bacterium]|nr:helix-turn-helix domain-containing protein [Gammaproteobacteria bacterium]
MGGEYLVEVATELFNRCGYHASGIARVIAEAGIAKVARYRHFPPREGLVLAVLKRIDAR